MGKECEGITVLLPEFLKPTVQTAECLARPGRHMTLLVRPGIYHVGKSGKPEDARGAVHEQSNQSLSHCLHICIAWSLLVHSSF
jgi:hypothetical protein